jgi:hypothetical protein
MLFVLLLLQFCGNNIIVFISLNSQRFIWFSNSTGLLIHPALLIHYSAKFIIIIIIIPFMQGIHTYIPETNHVSRVYSAAAILRVLLMVHIALSAILNSVVLLH